MVIYFQCSIGVPLSESLSLEAPPTAVDATSRKDLVQALLDDLQTCSRSSGNKGRLVINGEPFIRCAPGSTWAAIY
jgi:hypothetical protein